MEHIKEKAQLLSRGLDKVFSREHYKWLVLEQESEFINSLDAFTHKLLWQLHCSRYKKIARVRDKIGDIVKTGKAIFFTLTFRDDVLASTSEETRRKYVRRFLKRYCAVYVANIDYGSKGGREHYHAVGYPYEDTIIDGAWSYGFSKLLRVRNQDLDVVKTSKYVAKLSNHALKNREAAPPRLIYSRLA